jgi:hypothetical protein
MLQGVNMGLTGFRFCSIASTSLVSG